MLAPKIGLRTAALCYLISSPNQGAHCWSKLRPQNERLKNSILVGRGGESKVVRVEAFFRVVYTALQPCLRVIHM